MPYVFNLMYDFKVDILSITETWLTHECSSTFVDISGFVFFRGDTAGTVRKHGAGLYVSKDLAPLLMDMHLPNIVLVYLSNLDLYIISVYRPPSYSQNENIALVSFLLEFSLGRGQGVIGDGGF